MSSKLTPGMVGGLAGGIVFGIIMQMMSAPTPDGGTVPMMVMVAMVVKSNSLAVGWLYHLFNSAVIGAAFALLLGNRVTGTGAGAAWGAAWGVVWWVLGGLILMPVLLGMPAFASLRMPTMRPVAMGSLIGHLIYGTIMGVVYARLATSSPTHQMQAAHR